MDPLEERKIEEKFYLIKQSIHVDIKDEEQELQNEILDSKIAKEEKEIKVISGIRLKIDHT